MLKLEINGKEYKLKFTHRCLAEGDLLDRIIGGSEKVEKNPMSDVINLAADVMLAGLQKFHSDEFGYSTDAERKEQIGKVLDLFDDYEEEHEGDKEPHNSFTLYNDIQNELAKNGFLSQVLLVAEHMKDQEK